MTISKWQGTFISAKQVNTPFDSVEIKYSNTKDEEKMQRFGTSFLQTKPELLETISSLESGQLIELDMTKNAKGYWQPVDIRTIEKFTEKKEYKPFGKKSEYKDNTVGQIKGNVVSNAVALAVGREEMDQAGLARAAKDVLELHRQLEAMDISSIVGLSSKTDTKVSFKSSDQPMASVSTKDILSSLNKKMTKKSELI